MECIYKVHDAISAAFYGVALFGVAGTLQIAQVSSFICTPFSEHIVVAVNSHLVGLVWKTMQASPVVYYFICLFACLVFYMHIHIGNTSFADVFRVLWTVYLSIFIFCGQLSILQYVFEKRKKAHITFSGDHIPREESALVFSNHRSWIDYYMIHSVASRRNMLHNCKYFVKDSIKWLPFFGWGMWLAGFVFVRRNWTKDQKKIKKSFSKIKRMKTPVWIISYLEGSRFTTEKMIECQAFSKERGLPILQHVLTPRTKGFVTCVQEFRNSHVKCVYDFTIAYRHNIKNNPSSGFLEAPSMVRLHTRRLSPEYDFHVHVKRFMIDELPEEEDALSGWVMERYVEKDRFLASLKDDWLKGQEIDLCIK